MLHAKFQDHRDSDYDKKVFKAFYHICAWCPSCLCDLGHLYKISFPVPEKTPEIWLCLAEWFQRRSLKKVDGWMDAVSMGVL